MEVVDETDRRRTVDLKAQSTGAPRRKGVYHANKEPWKVVQNSREASQTIRQVAYIFPRDTAVHCCSRKRMSVRNVERTATVQYVPRISPARNL